MIMIYNDFSRGNYFLQYNKLEEAVAAYRSAIAKHPNFYIYHHNLGEALEKLNRFEEAIEAYHKALQLNPSAAFSYLNLSRVYEKLGDQKESKKAKERAIQLDSKIESIPIQADKPRDHNKKNSQKNISSQEAKPVEREICGKYRTYPDLTGKRQAEGGLRLYQGVKTSTAEEPLVSVITVVYNNSITLERCINSVLNQNYKNIEYIIIDGGSDKTTLGIIQKYSEQIDYFISEPDRGIYNAMNKGLELAFGEYICILNSDDWYSPNFVSSCIDKALQENSSIVYTYCKHGDNKWVAPKINEGIFLSHLNISQGSLFVKKNCYDKVGKYSENYRIVSDIHWIQRAFQNGAKFSLIPEFLFHFSEGGVSSGNSENRKKLMIDEIVKITKKQFSFLEDREIEDIYLFRFKKDKIADILSIAKKYKNEKLFVSSLSSYIAYCFEYRDNFRLSHTESSNLFLDFVKASEELSIPKSSIRINTKYGCFSSLIKSIEATASKRKINRKKVVLHYVFTFSSASEVFIYDLLCRLENYTGFDNYILYDNRELEKERPYQKELQVCWAELRKEIRDELYKYIFAHIKPDLIIAHFALNEWKLSQRLKPLGISIPTISMTHGIDVFSMRTKPEYKKYLLNEFCQRKNTSFTAVSKYLKNELTSHGIPKDKITLVHNTVNESFFEHRKKSNFYQKNRTLQLLAIGRFIEWKGHIYLLDGLKYFKDNYCSDVHLTIVYGKSKECYDKVVDRINTLSLNSNVSLIPFVDFSKEPNFFQAFDIFIQPSTYSQDSLNRSESFGVAPLEAIAAGLPVIVTDAGTLPEVIGYQNKFAKIVPHANGSAIGKALQEFFNEAECFDDNSEYAKERLSLFSSKKQLVLLTKEILRVCGSQLNVALFSSSTVGGAGYSAFRIHQGLQKIKSVLPTLFTKVKNHESFPGVQVVPNPSTPFDGRTWNILQDSSFRKEGFTIFSINHPFITSQQLASMVKDADIINLHWTARFLSIENIAQLSNMGKPLVITIRDMNPITGGCHFFHGCQKWKESCENCPQLIDTFDDFPSKVIKAKRRYYNFDNITIVTLSRHTAEIIKQAPFFNQCRLEIIPNSIDTNVFTPYNKYEARKKLGLPVERKIIGYVPSFSSTVKGYRELLAAFDILKQKYKELKPYVMLVGKETPANKEIKFDNQSLGYIDSNDKLALAYSAADLVVVPSLEETFSNTTAESIACGTPVVGFQTGAIPDMVKDGVTGYTFPVGDVEGLARGMYMTLTGDDMSENCRSYAEQHLSFMIQARRYEKLFYELYVSNVASSKPPNYHAISCFPETTPTVINLLTYKALNN